MTKVRIIYLVKINSKAIEDKANYLKEMKQNLKYRSDIAMIKLPPGKKKYAHVGSIVKEEKLNSKFSNNDDKVKSKNDIISLVSSTPDNNKIKVKKSLKNSRKCSNEKMQAKFSISRGFSKEKSQDQTEMTNQNKIKRYPTESYSINPCARSNNDTQYEEAFNATFNSLSHLKSQQNAQENTRNKLKELGKFQDDEKLKRGKSVSNPSHEIFNFNLNQHNIRPVVSKYKDIQEIHSNRDNKPIAKGGKHSLVVQPKFNREFLLKLDEKIPKEESGK